MGTEQAARGDLSGLCSLYLFFLPFSSDMLTDSWHIVSDGLFTLFLGQSTWNLTAVLPQGRPRESLTSPRPLQ